MNAVVYITSRRGAMAASHSALLLASHASSHTASADLTRALLSVSTLTQATATIRLVVDLREGTHWSATLLLLRVGVHQSVEVLRRCARTCALVRLLNHNLVVWELTTTARLLAVASTPT